MKLSHSVCCVSCHDAVGNPDRVPLLSYFASIPALSAATNTLIQWEKKEKKRETRVTQLTEKRITQRNSLHPTHIQIRQQIRIQIKKHRHIHRLPRVQPLLLKAKTLNLAEIRRRLRRRHAIRRHPNNILIAKICRRVKSQRRLTGEHAHFALLGGEFPWQDIRDGGVEGDADAFGAFDGFEAVGEVLGGVGVGADGLAAPACSLANLREFLVRDKLRDAERKSMCAYHFVKWDGTVGKCDGAQDDTEGVEPVCTSACDLYNYHA